MGMGNASTWQEVADASLARLAIALQPHHKARLDKEACFALACVLRQQVQELPGMTVEAAILTDLVERMESRIATYRAPQTQAAQSFACIQGGS